MEIRVLGLVLLLGVTTWLFFRLADRLKVQK
jgi:hypothetical protein